MTEQINPYRQIAKFEREDVASRVFGKDKRERYELYLQNVESLTKYMKEEGILRLPVELRSRSTGNLMEAQITADGRIVTSEQSGRVIKREKERQYHLTDLAEVMNLLGKKVKSLDEVCTSDFEVLRSIFETAVRCNI